MRTRANQAPFPSYLPSGFAHRLDAYGTDTAAFGFDPEQIARVFTRDHSLGVKSRCVV
jgi:hypothetical protein